MEEKIDEFHDLFPERLMKRYTNFKSIDELLEVLGINNQDDLDKLSKHKMDKFISANTLFDDWDSMYKYVQRAQIDFGL
ncbi:hypothetical protein ACWCL1_02900 [Ligilactobacillus sp. LYQ135]